MLKRQLNREALRKLREGEREAMALLQIALVENHYYVADVKAMYRRDESDFAALPKDNPHEMVIIRRTGNGSVVVRPFSVRPVGIEAIVRTAREKASVSIKWGGGLAPVCRGRKVTSWTDYIDEDCLQELSDLGCT